ncbi:MAG: Non-ribosomal peptide synthetase [Candidatus Acidoferrum typicum]|nr:Non-ribosomal peptide synthetase [Candidatus Acidoferrum typicum]
MDDLSRRIANLSPEKRALLEKRLKETTPPSVPSAADSIAVIGMGCRFPGGANGPNAFWDLLTRGFDAVTQTPPHRWDAEAFFDPDPATAGKTNTRWGAYLDEVDQFDAGFFGIPPNEAARMDPQQRLLLEVGWEAFENAGQTQESLAGSRSGVFVGILSHSSDYYWMQLADLNGVDVYTSTGTAHSIMANRLSYQFNLQGPSMAVDTACSSSLVAVHLAIQSLRNRECDLALAGGVHVLLAPQNTVVLTKLNMMSPDGHCKAFDSRANGFVRGEGCGLVVLKRLEDAVADGDHILAIVRGSAVNQDGRSNGITAPNGLSQKALLRDALKNGGVNASQITYIEAHGTGTALGDPIEVEALSAVVGKEGPSGQRCFLGSVKTNIGHLEGAAGIAGMIKAVLCLQHRWIPPIVHFEKLNPHITLENTRFVIPTEGSAWSAGSEKRFAGVSSFGFGGTNAHVVLEEAAEIRQSSQTDAILPTEAAPPEPQLLAISARSPKSLKALGSSYQQLFSEQDAPGAAPLSDICYSAAVRRTHHNYRFAAVASSFQQFRERLDSFLQDKTQGYSLGHLSQDSHRGPVFVFSGQGPQWYGMGRELLNEEPVFRDMIHRCDERLRQYADWSLLKELSASESQSRLSDTEFAQPAIFALQVGLAELLRHWGVVPDAVIGHSIGEVAAAYVCGALSFEDAVHVIYHRGRLMQRATGHGKMASIELPLPEVEAVLAPYAGRLFLAAMNSPGTTVVAGEPDTLEQLLKSLQSRGVAFRALPVKYAFHSHQMDPLQQELLESLQSIRPQACSIPMISTVSGAVCDGKALDHKYWWRNVRQPVRFSNGINALLEGGQSLFLEVGPHPVLSPAILESASNHGTKATVTPSLRRRESERASLLNALGVLYTAGCKLNWAELYPKNSRFVDLPSYSWQHKRFWLEPPPAEQMPATTPQRAAPAPISTLPLHTAPTPPSSPAPETSSTETQKLSSDSTSNEPRKERILQTLVPLLQDLAGLELGVIKPDLTFVEMGFDSLFLTQVSQAFSKKFGVKISMGQMWEDLNTPERIAAFLDDNLPPEPVREEPPKIQAASSATVPAQPFTAQATGLSSEMAARVAAIPVSLNGNVADLGRLVQDLKTVTRRLEVLYGSGPDLKGNNGAAIGVEEGFAPPPSQHSSVSAAPVAANPALQSNAEAKSDVIAHGPFKPIAKGPSQGLTESQQAYLDLLIDRYTKRTLESKRLTQNHRPHLADPRSVAGFNRLWKEMVYPIVVERSSGAHVWDIDGNEYVDFTMGFGTNLLGHLPGFVRAALEEQLRKGIEVGPQNPLAGKVAELICELTGMERCAFCNTGSEAVLAAIRMARTVSGRELIVYFTGDYHGIFDEVLQRPTAGGTGTLPVAPGIPGQPSRNVLVLEYDKPQSLEVIRARGSEIAAVIVEPVQSRHPNIQPRDFLHRLREITRESGTALVFDEVITGFRSHPGGVQALWGIRADLASYGKVIGGGMPIGAVCGSATYMDSLDGGSWQYGDASIPEVGVTYLAGTYVRHPLALAAARVTLEHLKREGPSLQQRLNERTAGLVKELNDFLSGHQVDVHIENFSSLFWVVLNPKLKYANLLFFLLRDKGIHIFEGRIFFLSTAHTDADLQHFIRAFQESVQEMIAAGFLPGQIGPSNPHHASPAAVPAILLSSVEPKTSSQAPSSAGSVSANAGQKGHEQGAEPRMRVLPLSEAQQGLWLLTKMVPGADRAYMESTTLEMRGALNVDVLRRALQSLVDRHEALRTTIDPDGERQIVHDHLALEVPLVDLSSLPEQERKSQLQNQFRDLESRTFDFYQGPVIRARVFRLSQQHHLLVMVTHHIFGNGPSYEVFSGELCEMYAALINGKTPEMAPAMQLSDYALWREQQSGGPAFGSDRKFWLDLFSDSVPVLDLPSDRPRPSVLNYRGGRQSLIIDRGLTAALRKTSRELRSSLFATLFAGFNVLLHRLTGQSSLVVGVPFEGEVRTLPGGSHLYANTTNMLPLRSHLGPDTKFVDFLSASKSLIFRASEHQSYFFGQLTRDLGLRHDPSRAPIIAASFNIDAWRNYRKTGGGLQFEVVMDGVPFSNPRDASKFELNLNIFDMGDELRIDCDYSAELFEAATVARWLRHYVNLLQAIVANPAQTLSTLPLLSESERREQVVAWNKTDVVFPRESVTDLFEVQANISSDARAVTFEGLHLTYKQLNSRVNLLAHHLKGLGVGPGTLVGVLVERSLDMVVALLSVLKAGGAYVPLDPSFPQDRLAYMVSDSGMAVLVTHRGLDRKLPSPPSSIVHLDNDWSEIAKQTADSPLPRVNPTDLCYVLYTSGSTGRPKGVEIPHSALVNFLHSMQREPGFTAHDTLLAVTTLSFDIAGLELYLPLVTGGKLLIASRDDARDPVRLMERMRDSRCTVMQATPATWRALIDAGWTGSKQLRVLCGGDSLVPELAKDLLPRCSELWNVYGPTETTIWSSVHKVTSVNGPVPIGHPIANTQFFALDATRSLLPPGVIGELYIGGNGLARGYLHRPELTAERFIPSPFKPEARLYSTGDLGRRRADGTLECLGRVDNQVKIRGFRVELEEIEAILGQHPAIRKAVVAAREDHLGLKQLVAYLQPQNNSMPSIGDLRSYAKEKLPEYMIPSAFLTLETFPMTPNGKIDRKALPAPSDQPLEARRQYVAPREPLEKTLVAIWAKVLQKTVGMRDDFFELGGHSLAALKVLTEVKKQTGKTLPLTTFFQASTVEAVADILRKEVQNPSGSSLVPIQPAGSRPPLFLVHGAEGNVLLYRQVSRYLPLDQPVYGLQSRIDDGHGLENQTVEGMASHYLQEIRAVQPRGPFFLGGYCMGGVIALEIAQQLRALGEHVGLVIMLDTYNYKTVSLTKVRLQSPLHFMQNLWFHIANAASIPAKERKQFVRQKLDTEWARWGVRMHHTASRFHAYSDAEQNEYPHLLIKRMNDEASLRYEPFVYEGRVAVIRPKGSFLGLSSPTLGWEGIIRNGLEVYELPVYPKGMLVEPFCRTLAETLQNCLQNASGDYSVERGELRQAS